jgi:VanZ family protein
MFNKIAKSSGPLAVGWILLVSVLCFLPGSAFPKLGWLNDIFFDKWVHFGLFAVLLFLWRFQFPPTVGYSFMLLVLSVIYAFIIETIQHYYIPNRSFDLGDVVADLAGGIAGAWFWLWLYKKNRPL